MQEPGQTYQAQTLSPSPTNVSPSSITPELPAIPSRIHPQSLPATPTNVRTFTDFSGEHTRLTTLHGSTGALEVNNLGGFKLGPTALNGHVNGQTSSAKFPMANAFESTIDGFVKTSADGMNGHGVPPNQELPPGLTTIRKPVVPDMNPSPPMGPPQEIDDEISDVFSGLTMKDSLIAAPGYGRSRNRRSSAPVNSSINLWERDNGENVGVFTGKTFGGSALGVFSGWNGTVPPQAYAQNGGQPSNIWSASFQGSRPDSQTSSYSNSEGGSVSGFSPIYSPIATTTNGFFPEAVGNGPLTTAAMADEQRPTFKVCM